jgi:predicted DCC family thiol-disulfide oxidoreductase YuxK
MQLLFDGECRFCRAWCSLIAVWDRRGAVELRPFGDPHAEHALAGLAPDERYTSFHVVDRGVLYSGTAAAEHVLGELPGGHALRAVGAHRLYPVLARYRGILGRVLPDRRCPDPARVR